MAKPAEKKAAYEDLRDLPDNVVGQIIDGELIATPRPSRNHARAASVLGTRVTVPYDFGEGNGPGGWIFLDEPEIKLGEDILVPDLSGWRKERFPVSEETNWISVCPDWICEVLSPGTIRVDKIKKMTIYVRYGVRYFWLIDPADRTLDVLKLESGRWVMLGVYADSDKVRSEPFQEIEIDLGGLWFEQPGATESTSK